MVTPDAFFNRDGEAFVPTPLAQGPWGSTVTGNRVGGILAWAIERDADNRELQPARLTVDLLRATAMAPVRVQTTVSREGRRLRLVDAQLVQNGDVVARASALFLRRSDQPPDDVWSSPITRPPPPAESDEPPQDAHMFFWSYDLNPVQGNRQDSNRSHQTPIKSEEPLTHWGTGGLKFINADYTLALSRQPEGPYIGLAALTHYSHAGIATGVAHPSTPCRRAVALVGTPANRRRPTPAPCWSTNSRRRRGSRYSTTGPVTGTARTPRASDLDRRARRRCDRRDAHGAL